MAPVSIYSEGGGLGCVNMYANLSAFTMRLNFTVKRCSLRSEPQNNVCDEPPCTEAVFCYTNLTIQIMLGISALYLLVPPKRSLMAAKYSHPCNIFKVELKNLILTE